MKIQSINNNLNFQKQIKADCAVIKKDGTAEKCKIYRLNQKEDREYFKNLRKDNAWREGKYIEYASSQLPRAENCASSTYVIENQKGNCLGFCEVTNAQDDYIEYIESCPDYRNKTHKYIGETLLAFIAKQGKNKNVNGIALTSKKIAKPFYESHGFKTIAGNYMRLNQDEYQNLISQNETHTGAKINLQA